MVDNDFVHTGAMQRSDEYKKQLALKSLRHCSDDSQFGELFPELKQEIDGKLEANPDKYEAADDKLIATEDKDAWLIPLLGTIMFVAVISIAFYSWLYFLLVAGAILAIAVISIAFT